MRHLDPVHGDVYCLVCWNEFLEQKPWLVGERVNVPDKRRRVDPPSAAASAATAAATSRPPSTPPAMPAEPLPDASVDSTATAAAPTHEWEVETDDGWAPWIPLSRQGHPKEIPEIGEELQHRSANGRWRYISVLHAETESIQRNTRTGAERRLRRVQPA